MNQDIAKMIILDCKNRGLPLHLAISFLRKKGFSEKIIIAALEEVIKLTKITKITNLH